MGSCAGLPSLRLGLYLQHVVFLGFESPDLKKKNLWFLLWLFFWRSSRNVNFVRTVDQCFSFHPMLRSLSKILNIHNPIRLSNHHIWTSGIFRSSVHPSMHLSSFSLYLSTCPSIHPSIISMSATMIPSSKLSILYIPLFNHPFICL